MLTLRSFLQKSLSEGLRESEDKSEYNPKGVLTKSETNNLIINLLEGKRGIRGMATWQISA